MLDEIIKSPRFSYKVFGDWALFTDPIMRLGGEKFTYSIPTYQALKGITESIYWKPTIVIHIDKVRVMKPILVEAKDMRLFKYSNSRSSDLARYTYLKDVEYQVLAHFEFNMNRLDLAKDRNIKKHLAIMKRCIKRGGRRDVFLGTRECQGYVEPCKFGEGEGYYDNSDDRLFGTMFHGFDYPDETGNSMLKARLWNVVMKKGVVDFIRPEDCLVHKPLHELQVKKFKKGENLESVDQLYSQMLEGDS